MRILVRDNLKGLYWVEGGLWVSERSAATEFNTVQAAVSSARRLMLTNIRVVLVYEDPACELALDPASCT